MKTLSKQMTTAMAYEIVLDWMNRNDSNLDPDFMHAMDDLSKLHKADLMMPGMCEAYEIVMADLDAQGEML